MLKAGCMAERLSRNLAMREGLKEGHQGHQMPHHLNHDGRQSIEGFEGIGLNSKQPQSISPVTPLRLSEYVPLGSRMLRNHRRSTALLAVFSHYYLILLCPLISNC
jgi:hypothetical protein